MKKKLFLLLAVLLALASCQSYKNVPYLQNSEALLSDTVARPLYDARIQPKDLLTITVNTTDPSAAAPFNLTVQTPINANISNMYTTMQPSLQQYLVDNDGSINFPVIGTIRVGGMTKREAENFIAGQLKPYLKEVPIVTVRLSNYKISVLGEVARPGTFTVSNEKVNVFEALAMAGDLTIWGLRDNVKLIREGTDGHSSIIPLNLNDASLVESPYYYLQQNDVLYVTPNKTKSKNSDIGSSTTYWFTSTSILISVANLLITIFR